MTDDGCLVRPARAVRAGGALVRIVRYPPGAHYAPHAHRTATVSMIVFGGLEERSEQVCFQAGVGDCVVKPASFVHQNRIGPMGAVTLQFELTSDRDGRQLRVGDYGWLPVVPRIDRLLALFGTVAGVARSGWRRTGLRLPVDDAINTLVAEAQVHPRWPAPSWLPEVEQEIEHRLEQPVRMADLAAVAGVHRVHLSRTFQRVHRCTPSAYVQRRRVQRAAVLLQDPTVDAAQVAIRVGCCDQAHLCRLFARRMGLSPTQYQRLVRSWSRPEPEIGTEVANVQF